MEITVELFDVPRRYAGLARVQIAFEAEQVHLRDLLMALAGRFPNLAAHCFDGGRLRPGYLASISDRRFVTDPETPICGGDTVLIMSAEAGG